MSSPASAGRVEPAAARAAPGASESPRSSPSHHLRHLSESPVARGVGPGFGEAAQPGRPASRRAFQSFLRADDDMAPHSSCGAQGVIAPSQQRSTRHLRTHARHACRGLLPRLFCVGSEPTRTAR